MAARSIIAYETPSVLPTTLVNRFYSVQNQSPDEILHVVASDSAPGRGDPSFVQAPYAGGQVKAPAGSRIWVWTESGTARVVYEVAS